MGGRPKKYMTVVRLLEDLSLYSPAGIGRIAEERICTGDETLKKQIRQRVRITMARFATKHAFPHQGDGIVTLDGQAPTPGWYGWRWKQTYCEIDW